MACPAGACDAWALTYQLHFASHPVLPHPQHTWAGSFSFMTVFGPEECNPPPQHEALFSFLFLYSAFLLFAVVSLSASCLTLCSQKPFLSLILFLMIKIINTSLNTIHVELLLFPSVVTGAETRWTGELIGSGLYPDIFVNSLCCSLPRSLSK